MPSGVKDIQLLELKDTISQLNKTISTQNELISSLQKMLEERNAKDSEKDLLIANLQSQLAYLKNKVFGSTSEIRHDQLDGQLNLFGTPVGDEKPAEVIEPEVISVKGYTKERKPKATYDDKYNSVRSICKHFFTDIVGLSIKFFCVSLRHMSIIVGLVATTIVLISKGAVGEMSTAIQAGELAGSSLDMSGLSASGFAAMMLPLLFGMVTDQPTYQRINSAKSAKISKIACYLSCIIMIPLALMPAFIGSFGAYKYNASGNSAFFDVILNELPAIVCALIIAAVLAAVMSTIDCGLITMSTVLTRDIWQGALHKNPSEKQLKKITLVINILFMGSSTILALSSGSILGLLNSVYSFLAAACFVPFVGGIIWKRADAKSAIAASVVGVLTVLISWIPGVTFPLGNIIPSGLFPIIPSAIAFVLVGLFTGSSNTAAERN